MTINFFTHSVQEIYEHLQHQPKWTSFNHDYHLLHEKAGQLATLLLLHAAHTDVSLHPIPTCDPPSMERLRRDIQPTWDDFMSSLSDEQREKYHELEPFQSQIEWEMRKEAYALGMVNGMILLARIAPLFSHPNHSLWVEKREAMNV